MRAVVTMVIEIPDSEMSVNSIDGAVREKWKEFPPAGRSPTAGEGPSRAWDRVAREVERTAEKYDPGRLRRKGLERRQLWTSSGRVELRRQRYTDDLEEESYVLFDLRAGLERHRRSTAAARETYARLASLSMSYEKASEVAGLLPGESPSRMAIWKWTREEGKRLAAREGEERRRTFEYGDLLGAGGPAKDFVGIEADSTYVHEWRKKGNHEVYVGIAYDGKETVGRRRKLTNKVAVASLGGSKTFGQDLFVAAQKHHNVTEARHVLYSSDGAEPLETIRQEHFPHAPHHLDHAHVRRKVDEAYGHEHLDLAGEALELVFSRKRDEFESKVNSDMRRLPERRAKLEEMRDYLLKRWEWIYAARDMKASAPEVEFPTHLRGTGAEERMVGVLVPARRSLGAGGGHRMKRRGMGWTKKGAANIMRLRLRALGLQD